MSKEAIIRKWSLGKMRFKYERRRNTGGWGRFGGGWNWNVGIQAGGSTIIFNLLVASLRISWNSNV